MKEKLCNGCTQWISKKNWISDRCEGCRFLQWSLRVLQQCGPVMRTSEKFFDPQAAILDFAKSRRLQEPTLTASGTSHTAAGSIRTRRVTSETMASVFLNLKHTSVCR